MRRHIQQVLGEEHPYPATAYDNLAMTLLSERRAAEAERFELQALAIRRKRFGEMNGLVGRSLNHLGRIREERGSLAGAEKLYRDAFDVSHKAVKADASIRSATAFSFGALLAKTGRSRQAEPLLEEAFTTRLQLFGKEAWQTAEAESVLGGCCQTSNAIPRQNLTLGRAISSSKPSAANNSNPLCGPAIYSRPTLKRADNLLSPRR